MTGAELADRGPRLRGDGSLRPPISRPPRGRPLRATETSMARPTAPDHKRRLEDFSGALILVGAGRMGGAMLEGWIALGIDPAKIVVLEPNPSRELTKLTGRGLRVNPRS